MTDALADTIERSIDKHGWHCQWVHASRDFPPFAYSIGWGITRDWPECLIVGAIRQSLAHSMLWRIWESGAPPKPRTERADILDGFTCVMLSVDLSWYRFLFGRSIDAYMARELPRFDAVQCVWPTTSGVLPWDDGASDAFIARQPRVDKAMSPELAP